MHKEETQREKSKRNIAEVKEITCKGTKKKGGQQLLCVHITRYVSLDEGSAALTGRMNQDGGDALGTGCLQRLVTTQEQLGGGGHILWV